MGTRLRDAPAFRVPFQPAPQAGPSCLITDPIDVCQPWLYNAVRYPRRLVAMANHNTPDTNGSQFFITWKHTDTLRPQYTPFGIVTKGVDIVDKVAAGGASIDGDGEPVIPVKVERITVIN